MSFLGFLWFSPLFPIPVLTWVTCKILACPPSKSGFNINHTKIVRSSFWEIISNLRRCRAVCYKEHYFFSFPWMEQHQLAQSFAVAGVSYKVILKQLMEAWKIDLKGNVMRSICLSSAAPNFSWQRFDHLNGQSASMYWEEWSKQWGNPLSAALWLNLQECSTCIPSCLNKASNRNGQLLFRRLKKN